MPDRIIQNEVTEELADIIGSFRDLHASRDLIKAFKIDFAKSHVCQGDRRKTWHLHFNADNDKMIFTFLEPNGDSQSIQEIVLTSDTIKLHEANHTYPKGRQVVIIKDGTDEVIQDSVGFKTYAELAEFLESFQDAIKHSHRAVSGCTVRAETVDFAKSLLGKNPSGYFKPHDTVEVPDDQTVTKKARLNY